MEGNAKARPNLVCEMHRGEEDGYMEGEVLGETGVQMELLHRRLGHTSQSGMERLVKAQMVRGLEDGMNGEFGVCRGCVMGKASEAQHKRNNPAYKSKEQLDLVHTDLAGPFKPRAIYGHSRYNLVFVDDCSRKSWSVPLTTKDRVNKEMKSGYSSRKIKVGRCSRR